MNSKYSFSYLSIRGVTIALVLFASILIHIPLIDTNYNYSFEPDTTPCVEVTRSFYFFFKQPCAENAPHTLTSYPNYSDGQFISAALLANVLAPLCKAGIITTPLSDSNNSLIIYSMRWSGVLFDAAAVLFVFLMVVLLTGLPLIGFLISGLYYLLNIQLLPVDFTRTDHYTIFAAAWVMWASLKLYKAPARAGNYVWAAIGAGLMSASKINFPFYLLLMAAIMALLLYKQNIKAKHLLLFAVVFSVTFCLMYLRWLLYAENIAEVLKITLTVGEDWTKFWGTGNPFYYLWHQFFAHGFSWKVLLFICLFYTSYTWVLYSGIKTRNTFYLVLCGVFALQMLALMFSPKVGRYGLIVPVWATVFVALTFASVYKVTNSRLITTCSLMVVLLPIFTYQVSDYLSYVRLNRQKIQSIAETRMAAADYINAHITPGSVIALQHPPVSNPPVFDLPYHFNYNLLQFPFLYKEAFCSFYPPSIDSVKRIANYLLINDKERDYQLNMMQYHGCDAAVALRWKNFYDSLPVYFPEKKFSSHFSNYGVKAYYLYTLSDTPKTKCIERLNSSSAVSQNKVVLKWQYNHTLGAGAYRFQIQVAADSAMQWLLYGSRDGYVSKYRTARNPAKVTGTSPVLIPAAIQQAYNSGRFKALMDNAGLNEYRYDFENLFAVVLVNMAKQQQSFGESLKHALNEHDEGFKELIADIYKDRGDILAAHIDEYLRITSLAVTVAPLTADTLYTAQWQFALPFELQKDKKYYWRVRAKDNENVQSEWSNIQVIE